MSWDETIKEALIDALRESYGITRERVVDESGEDVDMDFDFDAYADGVLSYYRDMLDERGDAGEEVTRILREGMTEGWSRREMEQELQDVVGFMRSRSETIVTTELARFQSRMYMDLSRAQGASRVIWRCTQDDITCVLCLALDGNVYDITDDVLPLLSHPRCRCYLEAVYDESIGVGGSIKYKLHPYILRWKGLQVSAGQRPGRSKQPQLSSSACDAAHAQCS